MPNKEASQGRAVSEGSHTNDDLETLKYHLLGPSLTKAGQDQVDQSKVSEIIYNASKGSKYFNREEERSQTLTRKIERIVARKAQLKQQDLSIELRTADRLINEMELSRDLSQSIVHIDCDAFYAAVEQLEKPELKDIPFAVGSGVLTTCNYVARQFGCRSGMAGFVAKRLCPSLVFIRPNFQKYTSKAQEVRDILANYDPQFESASIDEAYLNVTQYCHENNIKPAEAIDKMRLEILQKTKITVSAGIAANTKLAKICSNLNKPNGQYILLNDRATILKFMKDLPTRKVNGVGRVLERELAELGIFTCGDIYEHRQYLKLLFGLKTFEFLVSCYLGLGRTTVQRAESYERKSVGTESTFNEESDPAKLKDKLRWTAEELEKDMLRAACKGKTLSLKVKLHTFDILTRQTVLPQATHSADDLYKYSLPMLLKLEQEIPEMTIRLIGLRCTHLLSTKKPDATAFFKCKKPRLETNNLVKPCSSETQQSGMATQLHDSGDHVDIGLPDDMESHPNTTGDLVNTLLDTCDREVDSSPEIGHSAVATEEWWVCPICLRPQESNDKGFNDHIDLCLSRRTIRDVIQKRPAPLHTKMMKPLLDKKGRNMRPDSRQTKLSFS